MKIIIKKSSATGKKIANIFTRADEAWEQEKKIVSSFGAEQFSRRSDCMGGGITSLRFEEVPDMRVWKEHGQYHNHYSPRRNTKKGMEIQDMFDAVPMVKRFDLDEVLGNNDPFRSMGFIRGSGEYFGFTIGDDWNIDLPDDAKEVTVAEYKKIFSQES